MGELKRRLARLEQGHQAGCECQSWQVPITELAFIRGDELPEDLSQLPERCPRCGRVILIRAILVHEAIVERPPTK